jgi:hypothetical protein
MEHEVKDTYFRRFLVPMIVTLLIICGIVVIIATPPGTPVAWNTFSSAFGANQMAGFRKV